MILLKVYTRMQPTLQHGCLWGLKNQHILRLLMGSNPMPSVHQNLVKSSKNACFYGVFALKPEVSLPPLATRVLHVEKC